MLEYKTICNEISKIISPVYLVGGAVRDILLGQEPKDYDFATPLIPDEIENLIRKAKRKPYLVGKRFGTIGVRVNGHLVEITTFRSEKYERGNRKPNVEFVNNINEDLSRRDFTINAMCLRCDDNYRLIDPFNGKNDLDNKIIKCVGKPKARFKEDPLRMLRVSRFTSQLNFLIDTDLEKTVTKMSHKILEISKERWVMEMDKLLMTNNPKKGLDFLARTRLLNFMFPEMALQVEYNQNSKYHSLTLWEHTKLVVSYSIQDINIRWASFLHDIGKPFTREEKPGRSTYIKHDLLGAEIVDKYANYLKWSNDRRNTVKNLVLNHLVENSPLKKYDDKAK